MSSTIITSRLYRFPYVTPSFGKHAKTWDADELERQRGQFLITAPLIPAGFGKHRGTRYPNSSYNVVEQGQRDALKSARLTKRDFVLVEGRRA